jgi:TusA-related sulfurtransferase
MFPSGYAGRGFRQINLAVIPKTPPRGRENRPAAGGTPEVKPSRGVPEGAASGRDHCPRQCRLLAILEFARRFVGNGVLSIYRLNYVFLLMERIAPNQITGRLKSLISGQNRSRDMAKYFVDLRDFAPPFPFLILHRKLEDLTAGQIVKVLLDSPTAWTELKRYCSDWGHELLRTEKTNDVCYLCIIQKSAAKGD